MPLEDVKDSMYRRLRFYQNVEDIDFIRRMANKEPETRPVVRHVDMMAPVLSARPEVTRLGPYIMAKVLKYPLVRPSSVMKTTGYQSLLNSTLSWRG